MSEGIEFDPLGIITVEFNEKTYRLTRPKFGQWRYFSRKLQTLYDDNRERLLALTEDASKEGPKQDKAQAALRAYQNQPFYESTIPWLPRSVRPTRRQEAARIRGRLAGLARRRPFHSDSDCRSLEVEPKSFWGDELADPDHTWRTHLDGTYLAVEAELIYAITRTGIALPVAEEYELWELAAAMGLHRMETIADYTEREIVEKSAAYYEETKEVRDAKLAGYAERRKNRSRERKAEKRAKVT